MINTDKPTRREIKLYMLERFRSMDKLSEDQFETLQKRADASCKAIDDLITQRFEFLEKARLLQASEYERRLELLNGEAGHLKDMQDKYVPREVYDRGQQAQVERWDKDLSAIVSERALITKDLTSRIEELTIYKTKQEGKTQLMQFIPWILTVISIMMLYYFNTRHG